MTEDNRPKKILMTWVGLVFVCLAMSFGVFNLVWPELQKKAEYSQDFGKALHWLIENEYPSEAREAWHKLVPYKTRWDTMVPSQWIGLGPEGPVINSRAFTGRDVVNWLFENHLNTAGTRVMHDLLNKGEWMPALDPERINLNLGSLNADFYYAISAQAYTDSQAMLQAYRESRGLEDTSPEDNDNLNTDRAPNPRTTLFLHWQFPVGWSCKACNTSGIIQADTTMGFWDIMNEAQQQHNSMAPYCLGKYTDGDFSFSRP